ncbi:hypothetical protein [Tenacibaculum jejuense]|uniref:Probable lipoprotein n=1 Tax=Tenacibaculum jejuense TaxID=584609 RepID=A0A238UBE7_9FLAO|nr:hypothetical protein [Tenacibaculum jejuense]SNR16481.1 Probable lipoprotein precursor [Tenacibaculum jejuense]
MKKILITLFAFSLLFISCKNATTAESTNNTSTTTSTSDTVNNTQSLDLLITKANGNLLGGFNLQPIKIVSNGKNFTYKAKPNKHKFYTNGQMKYEVKFKEESLKLRDKNSNLLWKVKIYPDKIKISDNEENTNAFVIKPYENKIKVKKNEEELYKVKIDGTTISVNDKDSFQLSSTQENYTLALLAINEIPDEHKLFLLAELLNKL